MLNKMPEKMFADMIEAQGPLAADTLDGVVGRHDGGGTNATLRKLIHKTKQERDEALALASKANARAEAEYSEHMAFAHAAAANHERLTRERNEARDCLRDAICYLPQDEIPPPWVVAKWKKAAGLDTANAEAQRSPASGDKLPPLVRNSELKGD